MNGKQIARLRIYFTVLISCGAIAFLAWEDFHGGVKTHHILQSGALPGFSNWWGLLLLPSLT
jgi:hypothetical protein